MSDYIVQNWEFQLFHKIRKWWKLHDIRNKLNSKTDGIYDICDNKYHLITKDDNTRVILKNTQGLFQYDPQGHSMEIFRAGETAQFLGINIEKLQDS